MVLQVDLKFAEPLVPFVGLLAAVEGLEQADGIKDAGLTATIRTGNDDHIFKTG